MPAAPPPSSTETRTSESREGIPASGSDLRNPIARREFERFQAESNALRADYQSMRVHPTAEGLEALETRWRDVTSRIYNTADFEDVEFVTAAGIGARHRAKLALITCRSTPRVCARPTRG